MGKKGKKFSEEHKRKLSLAQRGKKRHSDEFKQKLSLIHKGNKYALGSKHSDEWKSKASENWMGDKNPARSLEVKQKKSELMKKKWKENEEYRKLMSEKQKGKKKHTEISKEKLRQARLKQVFPLQDTRPEIALQERLQEKGIQFETHKAIFGQPDIFIEPNICIFVDGCYWHNCPTCFLETKVRERDLEVTETLKKNGYKIFRFWEHEINSNIESCLNQIN